MSLHVGSWNDIFVTILELFISKWKIDINEPTFQRKKWKQKWPWQNVYDLQTMGSTEYFVLADEWGRWKSPVGLLVSFFP